jgi:glutathione peroxidase
LVLALTPLKYSMKSKIILTAIVVMGLASMLAAKLSGNQSPQGAVPNSLYDIKMKTLDGKEIDFSQYRGKKLLIVNTASKCGKTPQYAGLEKLHEQYPGKVTVLGFPANNFLWQEPGSNAEIAEFCERNYGVKFQMFEKISVKGSDQHPLYQWLQAKTGHKPDWNFAKYLVNEDGTQVTFFKSSVQPLDNQLVGLILKP